MSIITTIQEAEDKFENNFAPKFANDGFVNDIATLDAYQERAIKSFLLSTHISILEAVVEEMEEMKIEEGHSLAESLAYNQALSDQIKSLTEVIEGLRK